MKAILTKLLILLMIMTKFTNQSDDLANLPIEMFSGVEDITKMYIICVKSQNLCKLSNFKPNTSGTLIIRKNKNKDIDFEINLLEIDGMRSNSFRKLEGFQILLEGVDIKITQSSIGCKSLIINAKSLDVKFTLFEYSKMLLKIEKETNLFNTNIIPNYSQFCSEEITRPVFDFLYRKKKENSTDIPYYVQDCDINDNTKFLELNKHLFNEINPNMNKKKNSGNATSIIVLLSEKVNLKNSTTIKGNVILSSLSLEMNSSIITASETGCDKDEITGSPKLFISHSFKCKLNAGSYGGRGGLGLPIEMKNPEECIKNAYSRMTTYGDAFKPMAGGATGANFFSTRNSEEISPGAIAIVTNTFNMDKLSKVIAGYDSTLETGGSSSSGGSVYIEAKKFDVNGTIHANGQSSTGLENGEGAGGRVFVNNLCWWKNESFIAHNTTRIEANKGNRGADEKFEKLLRKLSSDGLEEVEMKKLIYAEHGTVKFSLCDVGFSGAPCKKCKIGSVKYDILEEECETCWNQNKKGNLKFDSNMKNCEEFKCSKGVKISKNTNPYCLDMFQWVHNYFIKYKNLVFRLIIYLIVLMIICDIIKLIINTFLFDEKEKSKIPTKLEKIFEKKIPFNLNEKVTLNFQGHNTPKSPWFLEFEICKEFNSSFMMRGEVLALRREINRISTWPKKSKFILMLIKYLVPWIYQRYKLKFRKKVFNKIMAYLKKRNLMNKMKYKKGEKSVYNYILWSNSEFSTAQVTIVHLNLKSTKRRAFNVLIQGNCTIDFPLKINFNPLSLKHDLLLQFPEKKKSEIEKITETLRDKILDLNYIFRQLSADEDSMSFAYKMINLLNHLKLINEKFLVEYKLKCKFMVIEHLTYKWEKEKYQYNKLVVIKSKALDRLELLQKYMQSVNHSRNFEPQFSLIFIPGGSSAYLQLSDIVKQKRSSIFKNSTKITNLPYKSDLHIESKKRKNLALPKHKDMRNLNTNLDSLRAFKRTRKVKLVFSFLEAFSTWFENFNRAPLNITLSSREMYAVRVTLLFLFVLDFILGLFYFTMLAKHKSLWVNITYLFFMLFPNFLPFLYALIFQILWILTSRSKFAKILMKMNTNACWNLLIVCICFLVYFNFITTASEVTVLIFPYFFFLVKLGQNLLICSYEGSLNNKKISKVTSKLKKQEEDFEDEMEEMESDE